MTTTLQHTGDVVPMQRVLRRANDTFCCPYCFARYPAHYYGGTICVDCGGQWLIGDRPPLVGAERQAFDREYHPLYHRALDFEAAGLPADEAWQREFDALRARFWPEEQA